MARLGDVCTISSSNTPILDNQIWLLNLDMVEQQTGNIISYNYVGHDALNGSIIQFDTDNVLYSKLRPNLNKVVVPDRSGFVTSEMLPLKPDTRVLCREYLAAYLRSDAFVAWAVSKTAGAKMPRLGTKVLLDKEIPLPPLKEQRRIAAMLDKVSDLIVKRRAQMDKLNLLVKVQFVEMFGDQEINTKGWHQSTVGECCTLKSGVSLPADKENEGGSVPYIKVSDMNYPGNEYYITTSSRYVSRTTAGSGVFPVGTVIFPKRGGAISTNKKRLTTVPICADLNVMGVMAGELLHPSYLMTYFSMVDLGKLDNGSSVPQINNKDISPLRICLPPMELQEKFSTIIKQSDKLKFVIQQSLDKLETLKKAMIQQYFQ